MVVRPVEGTASAEDDSIVSTHLEERFIKSKRKRSTETLHDSSSDEETFFEKINGGKIDVN